MVTTELDPTEAQEAQEAPPAGTAPSKRPASTQRFIVRQTAIKCATDLVCSKQVEIEQLFRYAGRITAWIYSTKEDPDGKAQT